MRCPFQIVHRTSRESGGYAVLFSHGRRNSVSFIRKEKPLRHIPRAQSLLAFGILAVAHLLSSAVPIIGLLASALLALVGVLMWLVLMANAIQGKWFKRPGSAILQRTNARV